MNPFGRWWALVTAGMVLVGYAALRERLTMLREIIWPDRFVVEISDEEMERLSEPAPPFYQERIAR